MNWYETKCPKCGHIVILIGYTANVYPYESGYKCPRIDCLGEWSNLQIERGALSE